MSGLNKDLESDESPPKQSSVGARSLSSKAKHRKSHHSSSYSHIVSARQPSLYELSYLEGLKQQKQAVIEEENSTGKFTGQNSSRRTPLAYQLEEKDSETMILQPTPWSRNTNSANKMASNFAYLSQQVTKSSKKGGMSSTKSSGSKHLELQKALKAQADRKAAEKRKSTVSSSNVKDFQERQEAQI